MNRTLAAILVLAAGLAAQQPRPPLPVTSTPFRGVFVADPDDEGSVWVRGERYKLGLCSDGARYQPLFGPRAPRDYPIVFGLREVRAGSVPQPLAGNTAWQRDGDRFTRSRGLVDECWRASAGEAQQYFVVRRPTQAGSVQLRIDCTTDMVLVDEGPGARFVAAGLGDVRYSDAIVFDAAGSRLDLPVEADGAQLVITVPASFADRAQWPLVVDPFVTTVAVDVTASDIQDPKVACEPGSGNWLIVAEEHLSATDVDIVCYRYDNTPTLLDTTYADNTPNRTQNPDVGFLVQPQQFVIAWHNATVGVTNGSFQWRTRSAVGATQGSAFTTSAGIGSDPANRPMIGSALTSDRFLLVLFRKNTSGTDILATQLRNTGTGFGTLFVGPIVSPGLGTAAPGGVSTITNFTDKWVVVWRECSSAACTQQTVRMQAIASNNGVSPLTPEPAVNLATGLLEDEPSIAGHGGNLFAAWRSFDGATNSNDIRGVPIGVLGGVFTPLGVPQNLTVQEPNGATSREQTRPSVGYDGCRFVYGYLEQGPNLAVRPFAATIFTSGATIAWHEGHLQLGTAQALTIDVGSGTGALLGLHWAAFEETGGASLGDVKATVIDARVPGLTSIIHQTGCGLPAEPGISLSGTPALGRSFTVALSTPNGFPFLLVGPENISLLPPCGTCFIGVDVSAMSAFAVPSLNVAVPSDPALIQLRLAFQGLSLLQAGGCPSSFLGFDFALSDTVTIQIL